MKSFQMKTLIPLCALGLAVLSLSSLVTGCKHQPESVQPLEPPPPIPGPAHGCSFSYPEGWIPSVPDMELDPSRPTHYNIVRMTTVFEGPLVGQYNYRVNISVLRQELPKDKTLEGYVRTVELETRKQHPDYAESGEFRTVIAELPAVVTTFTATSNGVPIRKSQAVFIEDTDNVGYVITYDAPLEFYDEYANGLELVMHTFEFSWKQEGNR
jgi:hypothetical protein